MQFSQAFCKWSEMEQVKPPLSVFVYNYVKSLSLVKLKEQVHMCPMVGQGLMMLKE